MHLVPHANSTEQCRLKCCSFYAFSRAQHCTVLSHAGPEVAPAERLIHLYVNQRMKYSACIGELQQRRISRTYQACGVGGCQVVTRYKYVWWKLQARGKAHRRQRQARLASSQGAVDWDAQVGLVVPWSSILRLHGKNAVCECVCKCSAPLLAL